ncbi:efflux RND transporter periplasmic adaptor subunit [Aquabacter cavernae]|uniref:efflux RND transporter periplasmic adaptor subunit n=1 Tax=Aquabacter cavernae TaxID=2496029 RepID=UPI000F8C58AA|nr:efflux RND transporter periplasmic adaptor subunit [Aquabacter cavernae]
MPSSTHFLGVAIVFAAASVFAPAHAQTGAPPPDVGIVTAAPEPIVFANELPGRIAPTRIAEVVPRVTGIILERVFEQGTMVKEGDVLYRIDPAPFQVRVASAKATLERAKAVQLQARQLTDRQKELRERNVNSAQALDNAVAELAAADADVAAAQAGLDEAQLNLRYASVTAPISGRIGRATITEGALVSSSTGSLATIQRLDPVYADFTQSATEMLRLRRAMKDGTLQEVAPDEARVNLILEDGTRYPVSGKLLFSEAAVDASTGQVVLRGEFPNPSGDLLPGMYVRVEIDQGVQKNALAVPVQAVQRDTAGTAQLFIVKPDDTIERRTVTAGRIVGERWVIDANLKPGDRVVVDGFQKIGAGAKVTPKDWTPAKADAAPGDTKPVN